MNNLTILRSHAVPIIRGFILFKSLKVQIGTALAVQFIMLVIVVSSTLYLLDLRKHDYLILNLSGQLKVISQLMINHSSSYVDNAPRDYQSYYRDVKLYNQQIQNLIKRYDKIINALQARQLPIELLQSTKFSSAMTSSNRKIIPKISEQYEAIYCTWNKTARDELITAANAWQEFKDGFYKELGDDIKEPRLEAAALYVLLYEDNLMLAASELTDAFRTMMEEKLEQIYLLNKSSIFLSLIIALMVFWIIYRKVFKPMDLTIEGFQRVSQGELTHRVEVSSSLELGKLANSFNDLTSRLNSLFGLTDRIYQATNLDEILQFIHEEFNELLPIDCLAMLRTDVAKQQMTVGHIYSIEDHGLHEGDSVFLSHPVIQKVLTHKNVISIDDLAVELSKYKGDDNFFNHLLKINMQSVIIFPLSISGNENILLVFSAKEKNAYYNSHREFLGNISSQVSHAFDRTIGMESLVISAVEGLAKLAESRDPETGDHLKRMSLYSYILAEDLYDSGDFSEELNSSYARHIHNFAPMHDIGKVGVEDSILLKPGQLTADEWVEMKKHPVVGADVLRRCENQVNKAGYSMFKIGIEIAEGHHEKYNGKGYPYGRKGEEIPLSARIVALADVFDALTSRRPYKVAWPVDKALNLIDEESGEHFDPIIVKAFKRALPKIMDVYNQHKHV